MNHPTLIGSRGPDGPTRDGSNDVQFTVNYPGMYYVEFMFHYDESAIRGHFNMNIIVNSLGGGTLTTPKWAPDVYNSPSGESGAGSTAAGRVANAFVPLAAGDKIGVTAYQNSGGSMTQPPSNVTSYVKIVLVGF